MVGKRTTTTEDARIVGLKRRITDLESEKGALKGSLDALREELALVRRERGDANRELEVSRSRHSDSVSRNQKLSEELAAALRDIARLEGYRQRVEVEDKNARPAIPTVEEILSAWRANQASGLEMADQFRRGRYGR